VTASRYFDFLTDETTDVAGHGQFAVAVCYILGDEIKEQFIGLRFAAEEDSLVQVWHVTFLTFFASQELTTICSSVKVMIELDQCLGMIAAFQQKGLFGKLAQPLVMYIALRTT
jgi:hypothetical protein